LEDRRPRMLMKRPPTPHPASRQTLRPERPLSQSHKKFGRIRVNHNIEITL